MTATTETNPGDITSLKGLAHNKGRVVTYIRNGRRQYAILESGGPENMTDGPRIVFGYIVALELSASGVSQKDGITSGDFDAGMVIRLAEPAEYAGKVFPYGWTPA